MSVLEQIRFKDEVERVLSLSKLLKERDVHPKGLNSLKKVGDRYLQVRIDSKIDDAEIYLEKTERAYRYVYKLYSFTTYTFKSAEFYIDGDDVDFVDVSVKLALWCVKALDNNNVVLVHKKDMEIGDKIPLLTHSNPVDTSTLYLEKTLNGFRFLYQSFEPLELYWESAKFNFIEK